MRTFTKALATVCVGVMCLTALQNVSAGAYDEGEDMDIFTDSLGNRHMVWRELVNGVYQVFYSLEIVDDEYTTNYQSYMTQTINQNLNFDDGYLTIQNCQINGNLKLTRAQVSIINCTINGNVKIDMGTMIIRSTSLHGNLDIKNANLELRVNEINGNVKSQTNTDLFFQTVITGNEIDGNLDLKSGICYVVGNSVNGNLDIKSPATIQSVSDNDVNGMIKLTSDTSGFNGIQITNLTTNAAYPQCAMDPTTGLFYIIWVTNEGGYRAWYSGSDDVVEWSLPYVTDVVINTCDNPQMDFIAYGGTLSISWLQYGNAQIVADLDFDMIPDISDVNPLTYDSQIGIGTFSPDVIMADGTMGISVAIDYATNLTIKPTLAIASCPILNANYGPYFSVTIGSSDNFTAIIKMKFDPNALSTDTIKYLRMYWLRDDTNWKILKNVSAGEDTGVDLDNGYVWAVTAHFSTFTTADSSMVDSDSDGLTDAQEINADGSLPIVIDKFSDDSAERSLIFSGSDSQTVWLKVPISQIDILRASSTQMDVTSKLFQMSVQQMLYNDDAAVYQLSPQIYEDKVIWCDNRYDTVSGKCAVFLKTIGTPDEIQLSSINENSGNAKISGNYVVWSTYSSTSNKISVYNIERNEIIQSFGVSAGDLDIYGDIMVWSEMSVYGPDYLYTYKISTQELQQITTTDCGATHIYGDYIAYHDHTQGGLWLYQLSTQQYTRITTAGVNPWMLDIDDRYVAYLDITSNDIYAYVLATGDTIRLTNTFSYESNPSVDGGIVLWTDYRNGDPDIYGFDILKNFEIPICVASGNQGAASKYGDNIVWQDQRNSPLPRIYRGTIGTPSISIAIGDRNLDNIVMDGTNSEFPDFSVPLNYYLSTHSDSDDGVSDNFISVPLAFSTTAVGELTFSNLEINIYPALTDPVNWDTDGEGLSDGDEVLMYFTDPCDIDTDDDKLSDYDELMGIYHGYISDPNNPDTDGDKINDGVEVNVLSTQNSEINTFTDGFSTKDIIFTEAGSQTISFEIPITAEAIEYAQASSVQFACQEYLVIDKTKYHHKLAMNDNTIVWADKVDGNYDIKSYNFINDVSNQIPTLSGDQVEPAMYNNIVVWTDYRNDADGKYTGTGDNGDIYLYNIATGVGKYISSSTQNDFDPAIYGNYVVWVRENNNQHDIILYDIEKGYENSATGEIATLGGMPYNQFEPSIWGQRIVWTDSRDGNLNIYMHDISTGITIPVTNNQAIQDSPCIYEDVIVWRDNRNSNWDIYSCTVGTSGENKLSKMSSNEFSPMVWQAGVVWTKANDDHFDAQWYSDGVTLTTFPHSTLTDQLLCTAWGQNIAWIDSSGSGSKITIYSVGDAPQATITSITPDPASPDTYTFQGIGSAAGSATIMDYRWYSDLDGLLSSADTFTTSSMTKGTHDISFTVRSSNGLWAIPFHSTIVINNDIPIAYISSISANAVIKGQSVTFYGLGTDSDGSIVKYRWVSSLDGDIGSQASLATNMLSSGNHEIFFSVMDDAGEWSTVVSSGPIIVSESSVTTGNIPTGGGMIWQSTYPRLISIQVTAGASSNFGISVDGRTSRNVKNSGTYSYVGYATSISLSSFDSGESGTYSVLPGILTSYSGNIKSEDVIWESDVLREVTVKVVSNTGEFEINANGNWRSLANLGTYWYVGRTGSIGIDSPGGSFSGTYQITLGILNGYSGLFYDSGSTEVVWESDTARDATVRVTSTSGTFSVNANGNARTMAYPGTYWYVGITSCVQMTYVGSGDSGNYEIILGVPGSASSYTGTFAYAASTQVVWESDTARVATVKVSSTSGSFAVNANGNTRSIASPGTYWYIGSTNCVQLSSMDSGDGGNYVITLGVVDTPYGYSGTISDAGTSEVVWESDIDRLMTVKVVSTDPDLGDTFSVKIDGATRATLAKPGTYWYVGNIHLVELSLFGPDDAGIYEIKNGIAESYSGSLFHDGVSGGSEVIWESDTSILGCQVDIVASSGSFTASVNGGSTVTVSATTPLSYTGALYSIVISSFSSSDTGSYQITRTNQAPVAEIISISPNPVTAGSAITFVGSGTDSDGFIDGYSWSIWVIGGCDPAVFTNTQTFSWVTTIVGTHTVYFSVCDDDGVWASSDIATITVTAASSIISIPAPMIYEDKLPSSNYNCGNSINDPTLLTTVPSELPIASIDSIGPSPSRYNELVTMRGHGTGANGRTIKAFSWRSGATALGTSATTSTQSLSAGIHIIYFKVQDSSGLWSEEVGSVLVVKSNIPPMALISAPMDSAVFVFGEDIVFNAGTSSDSNNDRLTFNWDFGDGATSTNVVSHHAYIIADNNQNQETTYTIRLTVNDGILVSETSIHIHVRSNIMPTISYTPNIRTTLNYEYKSTLASPTISVEVANDDWTNQNFRLTTETISLTKGINNYLTLFHQANVAGTATIVLKISSTSAGLIRVSSLFVQVSILVLDSSFPDTDLDNLDDGIEVYVHGTNPCVQDTDGDTLSDYYEIMGTPTRPEFRSDPLLWDTDNDGLNDYEEYSYIGLNPQNRDTDGDYLFDGDELYPSLYHKDWLYTPYSSNPLNPHSDNDGLNDHAEAIFLCNPKAVDTDRDYLWDGDEIDPINFHKDYYETAFSSSPTVMDSDADGLTDYEEARYQSNPMTSNSDEDGISDPDELTYLLNTPRYHSSGEGTIIYGEQTYNFIVEMPPIYGTVQMVYLYLRIMYPYLGWQFTLSYSSQGVTINQFEIEYSTEQYLVGAHDPDWYHPLTLTKGSVWTLSVYSPEPYVLDILQEFSLLFYKSPSPTLTDSDGDGWNDSLEIGQGTDPTYWNDISVGLDTDGDGLSNSVEDADGDGAIDGDTNNNGIIDYGEIWHETNPNNPDSDGDGLWDGDEIDPITIHKDAYETKFPSDPKLKNSDSDTLDDRQEAIYQSNPKLKHSDNDGLDDAQEIAFGCSPTNPDSDVINGMMVGDGLYDGWVDTNGDGVYNAGEPKGELGDPDLGYAGGLGTDPHDPDMDNDGLRDGWEDTNGDGWYQPGETWGEIGNSLQGLGGYGTSPTDEDSDNDGINDGPESIYWLTQTGTRAVDSIGTLLNNPNSDGDGWTDGEEINTYFTNPGLTSTDSDGVPDDCDIDPLVNTQVTLKITEIEAKDDVDPNNDPADFFIRCNINGVLFGRNPTINDDTPSNYLVNKNGIGTWDQDNHKTPDEIENQLQFTVDVSDDKTQYNSRMEIEIAISLFDDDYGRSPPDDDLCDITRFPISNTAYIFYSLKFAQWSGEDAIYFDPLSDPSNTPGDPPTGGIYDDRFEYNYGNYGRSYGMISGEEDGIRGDENDCIVWFDITQSDFDNDGWTYWEEMDYFGTNPKITNQKYAIVVGCSNYDDEPIYTNDLRCGDNDGKVVYDWLLAAGWSRDNVYFYVNSNLEDGDPGASELREYDVDGEPTTANVDNAFSIIDGCVTENDIIFFYYSGHGEAGTSSLWFVGEDKYSPISLLNKFSYLHAMHKILILDSCFAGGFVDEINKVISGNAYVDTIVIASSTSAETSGYLPPRFGIGDIELVTNSYTTLDITNYILQRPSEPITHPRSLQDVIDFLPERPTQHPQSADRGGIAQDIYYLDVGWCNI
ncbi:MAG: PKD domain-containing protein [Methanobacteriota archaeon]